MIAANSHMTGTIEPTSVAEYYFLVPENSQIHVSTCDTESDFDTEIYLYSNCTGKPYLVAKNNDDISCSAGTWLSTVTWVSQAEEWFCLEVSGMKSASGTFKLNVETAIANPPTLAPTVDTGCLKTCNGLSCSDIDKDYGTESGYCDYKGADLVAQFGCSCASCDCNTQGIDALALTMVMKAAVIPAGTFVSTLQNTIATALGLSKLAFENFAVAYTVSTTRRRLTTDYDWDVSLQLSVSLGATSYADPADLAAGYQATIASTDFTGVDSSLTVSSVSVVANINLTPNPVPSPTKNPIQGDPPTTPTTGAGGGKGNNVNSASASTIILAVVLSLVACSFCVGAAVLVFRRRQASFRNLLAADYKLESEKTWDEAAAGAPADNSKAKTKTAEFDNYGVEMNEVAAGEFDGNNEGRMTINPLSNAPGQGTAHNGEPQRTAPGGTDV